MREETEYRLIHYSALWARDGATPTCRDWLSVSSVRGAMSQFSLDAETLHSARMVRTSACTQVAILIPLSSFFGMIPVAYAADFFGRRITIQIGAAIYMYASFLLSLRGTK